MSRVPTIPLALALFITSLGCVQPSLKSTESAPSVEAELPRGISVLSNAGRYRVLYRPLPDPIPSGDLFSMLVWVYDAETDEPSGDIELVVDAGMPHHQHGMNTKPVLTEEASGARRVENLLFHMPGEWTITFDIERAGVTERAQAVLDVD